MDNIIHQHTRLRIMVILHMDKVATFSTLKSELDLTDWNLGIHLEKLEKAWYIEITKSFVNKKPQSTISITKSWEDELIEYINTMESIIKKVK